MGLVFLFHFYRVARMLLAPEKMLAGTCEEPRYGRAHIGGTDVPRTCFQDVLVPRQSLSTRYSFRTLPQDKSFLGDGSIE